MGATELVFIAAMIAVNSVFAGYEIALASITSARLRRLAEESKKGAAVALYMKENMEASLAVVQLGITLVGAVAAAVGGAGAEENIAPTLKTTFGVSEGTAEILALVFVVVPLTVVTIVIGELIPKVFALRHAERVCLALSPGMRFFSRLVWPAVWLFETITIGVMSLGDRKARDGALTPRSEMSELQDIRASAALARSSRLISSHEERIIVGATEMRDRPVGAIIIPAEDMSTLEAGRSLHENLELAWLDMHTRFPVVTDRKNPQSVIGYANFKDLVAALRPGSPESDFRSLIRPIPEFSADSTVSACLESMMRDHVHIAIVKDSSRRIIGLVTLEDLLEEVVGDIQDEYDRLPSHLTGAGVTFVAGGGIPLERLAERSPIDLRKEPPPPAEGQGPIQSLSDWVEAHLGGEVRGGEVLQRGPFRVMIRKVRRHRVHEAMIQLDSSAAPAPAPSTR